MSTYYVPHIEESKTVPQVECRAQWGSWTDGQMRPGQQEESWPGSALEEEIVGTQGGPPIHLGRGGAGL